MTKPTVPAESPESEPNASLGDPSPKAALHVLLIGHADRPEMAWAVSAARQGPAGGTSDEYNALRCGNGRPGSAVFRQAADLAAARELIDAGAPIPDVVVLVQPYPGCFLREEVEDFRQRFPLVRFVCLFGAWCEGESRSGRPLNGAVRLPWHQWPFQKGWQLAALADGQPGSWALPPTATQDEHLLARSSRSQHRLSGAVGIASLEQARALVAQQRGEISPLAACWDIRWTASAAPPSPARHTCRMVYEACAARGITGIYFRAERTETAIAAAQMEEKTAQRSEGRHALRTENSFPFQRIPSDAAATVAASKKIAPARASRFPQPLRGVVAEVASLDRYARSLAAQLASAIAPAPLALLANFPRIDQAAAAVALGASAVLAKPFDLDDLFAWLERHGVGMPGDSCDTTEPDSICPHGA